MKLRGTRKGYALCILLFVIFLLGTIFVPVEQLLALRPY